MRVNLTSVGCSPQSLQVVADIAAWVKAENVNSERQL